MSTRHESKVLILGSGPAGYTAAIYASRASLSPLLVKGMQPGGQLTMTTEVENFPGFEEAIQGPELMERMEKQALNVGATLMDDLIVEADLSKRPFVLKGDSGDEYAGETLIIATGASARWLGMESEEKYMGFGVSACATCDGFFYREKKVAVIGGGDAAAEEAIYLSHIASQVYLVHRRDELRADKTLQKRVFDNSKITMVWDSVPDEILGQDMPPGVTGLRVKNVKSGDTTDIDLDGVFVAIGHNPNTELFKGQLDMDEQGYLITKPDSAATNIEGVFAAGDVQDRHFRQAITAAGTGCMAALEAERLLTE